MSQDIAALSFQIDSSQAERATQSLDRMRGSVDQAVNSKKNLTAAAIDTQHSLGGLTDQTAALQKALQSTSPSLDDLIAKVQKAKTEFGSFAQSLKAWDDAANQVNALGRAFGTTAAGLANYTQAANNLNFTSQQTAQSLQRITLALENQTAAGAQLRQVINEYGVSLRDLNVDQADAALRRLQDRFSKVADTAKRTRDIQSIFGTLDPDSISAITSPNYVPIAQAKEAERVRTNDLSRSRQVEADRRTQDGIAQRAAREADLRQQFPDAFPPQVAGVRTPTLNPFRTIIGDGTIDPNAQRPFADEARGKGLAALRLYAQQNLPVDNAYRLEGTNSVAGRRAYLELLSSLPESYDKSGSYGPKEAAIDVANEARGNTFFGPGKGGLFTSNDGTTAAGRAFRGLFDGSYGDERLRQNTIADKSDEDDPSIGNRFVNGSVRGFLGPAFTAFGFRGPVKPIIPTSPFASAGDAQTLGSFGDQGLLRYQQAVDRLKQIGGGDQYNEAGADTSALFNGVYGPDGASELRVRRNSAVSDLQDSLRPGSQAVRQSVTGIRISRLALGDQGKQQALAAFVRSNGGDPEQEISPSLLRSFNESYANNSQTSNNEFRTQSNLQLGDLSAQATAASQSPTALQDKTTYQQAYNKAVRDTADESERLYRAQKAVDELDAQRLVQGRSLIEGLQDQVNLERDRQNLLGNPEAGAADRAIGAAQGDITTRTAQESKRLKGNLDEVSYARLLGEQNAQKAINSANQGLGSATDDLDKAQKLLSVSDQRVASQNKFNRELEIDIQYTKDRAALEGNDAALRAFDEKIRRIKELRNEQSLLNAEAAAYKLGRDANQDATNTRRLLAIPAGDARERARAAQSVETFGRDNGLIDQPALPSNFNQRPSNPNVVPVDQRAGILQNAVAGTPITPNLLNALITQESGWNPLAQRNGGSDLGLGQVLASTGAQPGYGVRGITRDQAQDPQTSATFAAQYLYKKATQVLGLTEADWSDPTKVAAALRLYNGGGDQNYAQNVMGRMNFSSPESRQNALDAAFSGTDNKFEADRAARLQTGREQADIQYRQAGAGLDATREGRTADANLQRLGTAPVGNLEAQQSSVLAVRQALQQYTIEAASAQAQTDLSTQSAYRMADATSKGGKAIGETTDALKIEAETNNLGAAAFDKIARARQLNTERVAQQNLSLQQSLKQNKEQTELLTADNDLGVFAGPQTRGLKRGEVQAKQTIDNSLYALTDDQKAGFTESQKALEVQKLLNEEQQKVRDGFIQMGNASFEAFNQIILKGGNAKQVLSGLLSSVADLFLKIAEAPLKNAAGDFFQGLLGGAGKLFGGTGSVGVGGPDRGGFGGADLPQAAGGAFLGGVRMMASGGILDRPTRFMFAGGGAIAGEVGNEAVMPLKRMPNGDLGVAGGGSGKSIVVNAPITVQGAAQDKDGKVDPKMMDALQKQLSESIRVAVLQSITDEKRPGGSLY